MSSAQMSMMTVDAETFAAEGGIGRYFDARTPVLLRGVASDWALMRKWSTDYLLSTMGDYECVITRDSRPALSKERCALRDYLSRDYRDAGTISFQHVTADQPRFLDDLPLPNSCFAREQLSGLFFYHAPPAMGGLPHCHQDAFNVLQHGRKRWLLYDADPKSAPQGDAILRRCHAEFGPGTHARDWFIAGPETLTREGIRIHECVQEPGDIVYIPQRFAHAVLNFEASMGVVALTHRPDAPYKLEADGRFSPH